MPVNGPSHLLVILKGSLDLLFSTQLTYIIPYDTQLGYYSLGF